jgi:hypothetical protein
VAQALSDITDLATWAPFTRKVQAAMILAATQVAAEIPDSSPRSTARRALSQNVFSDLDGYTARFGIAVATNPVITYESADSDIEFTVNSVWDAIAGAPPATT